MNFLQKRATSKNDNEMTDPSDVIAFPERIFAYLIGPGLVYLAITAVSGTYLIQFYTDVIGVSGILVTIMPFISKILVSVVNVLLGKMIDKSNHKSGKARFWLIPSGILLALTGALLYAVPSADSGFQILWIIVSYNIYFACSDNLYLLAHNLLYTRCSNSRRERERVSVYKNIAEAMIPGTLSAVIMPKLITHFGVGALAQSQWFRFMLYISILAIPFSVVEYCFSKERVQDSKQSQSVDFLTQLKDIVKDRKLVLVLILLLLSHLSSALSNNSMLYFSNWVLSNNVADGSTKQILLNVIGQGPMGIGLIALWPVVKKLGKIKTMKFGYLIAALGCLMVVVCVDSLPLVLIGMMIKSIGSLPGYLSMSLLSDCIDEFAQKKGYRCDTLTVSITSVITNLSVGVAQSVLLAGTSWLNYIAPQSTTQIVEQNAGIRFFFTFCFIGFILISSLASFAIIRNMEKEKR